jgi:hypothetical protein
MVSVYVESIGWTTDRLDELHLLNGLYALMDLLPVRME